MDLQAIPDSWAATNLGSIVDYGKTQKCELADIDGVTWVVELEDIEKDTSRIISRGYTPARDFKSSKNLFNKGDILYGKLRPYLNKVVMADENGVCSTEIIPINAEPLVINKYIFYWIKSHHFLDYVNDVSYGVNMPRLGTNDGLNAPFILAPFAEQKEIVDRLDILLAQVEATQARLARIKNIIKQFRQSVLATAVSGKLTEEWRQKNHALNKIPITEIDSYWASQYLKIGKKRPTLNITETLSLNETPEFEIPESWVNTQIGYVFDVYVGATPSRSIEDYWNGDVPWVSSSEVAFCRIDSTKEKITTLGLSNTSTNIHPPGTVMLAMIGQGKTRGQVAILDINACHNQNTAALRVPDGFAVSEYLYFYLTNRYEETRKIGGGNNQQALNHVQNLKRQAN